MVKKNNKVLYISIVSISIIVIGIVIWGFLTNWKYWNHKNIPDQPVLPTYKSNVKIAKGVKIDINEPVKKGFKIGQEIQIGSGKKSEIRTIVGFGSLILDSPLKYDHPKGTTIKVIKQTPTDKFSTKYCETYNKNGDCQKCFLNLPSKNGICVPSDTCKTENNCKTCNKIGTKCETCKSGYIPVNDGKCCIQRKVYVSQEDGHNILKCCDKELCGDNKCCSDTNKTCAIHANGNHNVCCEGNFASQHSCCGKDQILDKHGVCCDKEKIDNNGACCSFDIVSINGEGNKICRKKCNDSTKICNLDQQCSVDGQSCTTIGCNIDSVTKEFKANYIDGDNADNKENCKLKGDKLDVDNIKFEKTTCKYPVYKYHNNNNYQFLYLNNSYSRYNHIKDGTYTHSTQQTNGSCKSSDCSGTFQNHTCQTKNLVPIKNKNICPYEDKDRCCINENGNYTGQVCPFNNKCNMDDGSIYPLGNCVDKDTKCTGVTIPELDSPKACIHGEIQGKLYYKSCWCKCKPGYYGTFCGYKLQDYQYLKDVLKQDSVSDISIDGSGVKIGSILPNKWYVIEFTSGLHDFFYTRSGRNIL